MMDTDVYHAEKNACLVFFFKLIHIILILGQLGLPKNIFQSSSFPQDSVHVHLIVTKVTI